MDNIDPVVLRTVGTPTGAEPTTRPPAVYLGGACVLHDLVERP